MQLAIWLRRCEMTYFARTKDSLVYQRLDIIQLFLCNSRLANNQR